MLTWFRSVISRFWSSAPAVAGSRSDAAPPERSLGEHGKDVRAESEPSVPSVGHPLRSAVQDRSTAILADTFQCDVQSIEQRAATVVLKAPAREELEARLVQLKQIPALKSLAQRLTNSISRESISIPEVVGSISNDPGLCLRLLQMANSSSLALAEPVVDLDTAVQMLGVNRVRFLASAMLLKRDGETICGGFDWKHLWMHCLATAMMAERLDEWTGGHGGPSLPACAILHDVGKLALSVVAPEHYEAVLLTAWRERAPLPPLEMAGIGMDHAEAGLLFGREAGLPPILLDCIAFHDDPARAHTDHQCTVALVGVANQWAKLYGLGFSGDGAVLDLDLWETPAWQAWTKTLPSTPDPYEFANRQTRWVEEVKGSLKSFHA